MDAMVISGQFDDFVCRFGMYLDNRNCKMKLKKLKKPLLNLVMLNYFFFLF